MTQQQMEIQNQQQNAGAMSVIQAQLVNNDNASADLHLALIKISGGDNGKDSK
jgi:hypothetical protein